jgi:hypothetical protein
MGSKGFRIALLSSGKRLKAGMGKYVGCRDNGLLSRA